MTLHRAARISIGLGVAALVSVFVGHLALTDIYRGEGDLSQEWSALRVCFGVIAAFQLHALATLSRVAREAQGGSNSLRP